jgi:TonB family protein
VTDARTDTEPAGAATDHRPVDAGAALLDAADGSTPATQKCATPDAPARVLTASVPAGAYGGASAAGASADVSVSLTPAGSVASAYIAGSSGSADLDAAALDAAKRSTYSAALAGCVHVASSLTVHVRF